ncbi:ABC transporter permease [Kutzneria viridogrisea]|uniref:Binding-protein-dependent transporters inner membrane component n=2 Tax=Kutzneria TaxID=43356 RepID=W5WFC8_9PSEU|nr:ABC transporter permease [Kutzneria albida]AHH96869.1 binding-protein-dependent transporters inner membrane component [Kutzneria albida DSM 43870]MBA8927908.1 peptide/nickel transport system permease protein [Kutzneria viridogrisea]
MRLLWNRFRADRSAVFGAVVAGLLVLLAITAPLLTALEGQDTTSFHNDLVDSARGGVPLGGFGGISPQHWFGVEPQTGRDLFARIAEGAQVSLLVAICATLVEVLLGVAVGLLAGLSGKLVDALLSRVTDIAIAFPVTVFSLALLAIVPETFPRPLLVAVVIGVFGWGGTARITRAQALSLRTRDFVAAARLSGASGWRVARREILPGLAAPVITYGALLLPTNLIAEAGLSFLGVGVRPPTSSWGQMLSSATTWFRSDPVYVLLPAFMVFLTVLSFTLFGEGVRIALDPRSTRLSRKAA